MTKFGIIYEAQIANPTTALEHQYLRSAVDQAVLAEELGFDNWWSVEHHTLSGYSVSSAPEILLAQIAAKTTRLRIGHGIACTPFAMNHPVRLAERAATLDVLSNGRLNFGVGRSSSAIEQGVFGVSPEDTNVQLPEAVRAMVKMWTEDEAEYHSEHLSIPKRPYRPHPVQQPHPPLWVACTRDSTFELAGRWGLGALSFLIDAPEKVADKRKMYDDAIAARQPGDLLGVQAHDYFSHSILCVARDDADEAQRIGFRAQRYFMEIAGHFFGGTTRPDPSTYRDEENIDAIMDLQGSGKKAAGLAQGSLTTVGAGRADLHDPKNSAYGTPDHIIEYVEKVIAAGADEVFFAFNLGGIPLEVTIESIRQVGTHVLPHFRTKAPTVVAMSR